MRGVDGATVVTGAWEADGNVFLSQIDKKTYASRRGWCPTTLALCDSRRKRCASPESPSKKGLFTFPPSGTPSA